MTVLGELAGPETPCYRVSDSAQNDYINACRAVVFSGQPRMTTRKYVSRARSVAGMHGVAYPAAIIGTATSAATMPTVFQRVKRSPKKMRARMTVSAG